MLLLASSAVVLLLLPPPLLPPPPELLLLLLPTSPLSTLTMHTSLLLLLPLLLLLLPLPLLLLPLAAVGTTQSLRSWAPSVKGTAQAWPLVAVRGAGGHTTHTPSPPPGPEASKSTRQASIPCGVGCVGAEGSGVGDVWAHVTTYVMAV